MPRSDPKDIELLNFAIEQESRVLYSKFLGKTLTERCHELAADADGANLRAELLLLQALAGDALEAYEQSVESAKAAGCTGTQLALVKAKAGAVVRDALVSVRDMALAHKKMIATDRAIDPTAVQTVVLQTVQMIDSRLQTIAPQLRQAGIDPEQLARDFDNDLRQVRLPSASDGSSFEPCDVLDADEEAAMMDATVPSRPEPSHVERNGHHNGAA